MSVAFRSAQTTEPTVTAPETVKNTTETMQNEADVPYLDYERTTGTPFSVDYLKLGTLWRETYNDEVQTIENYLKNEVERGGKANTLEAIKDILKRAEKMTNTDKSDRIVVKMGILAEYVRFLDKTREIRSMGVKYGNQ